MFKYDYELGNFTLLEKKGITYTGKTVYNVFANDINNDDSLDLVITLKDDKTLLYQTDVILGKSTIDIDLSDKPITTESNHGVMIGDFLGDDKKSLLYYDDTDKTRKIKRYTTREEMYIDL